MHRTARRLLAASPALMLAFNACLPYTVGSTARTIPVNETTTNTSYYFIPSAVKSPGDSIAVPLGGADIEFRYGLDARSDIGARLLPAGVALDYKRRIDHDITGTGAAVAFMAGGGIVNSGEHLMFQGTLIASGREDVPVAAFGGIRAIQVIPISQGAVSDNPTIGVFGGAQVGNRYLTIRPELGVFYDHSALGVRSRNFIFVPAITLQRRRRVENTIDVRHGPSAPTLGQPMPVQPGRGCGFATCLSPRPVRRRSP